MTKKKNKRVLVIHGPNLNLLGERETSVYGRKTLTKINSLIARRGKELGLVTAVFQSNSEGEIVEKIQQAKKEFDGLVINPAAYTHTSIAIRDAILAVGLPTVEVHLSNIYQREQFRHHSYISAVATGQICGFGVDSYLLGLEAIMRLIRK